MSKSPEYADEESFLEDYRKTVLSSEENIEKGANYLLDQFIDDTIMSVVFEQHYLNRTAAIKAIEGNSSKMEASKSYDELKIIRAPNVDIFGNSTTKKTMEIVCPNCNKSVAAARFAPHLEKCMGMGRNSSRIASKRIASSSQGRSGAGDTYCDTDNDDDDWIDAKSKKKKAQTTRNNGSKRNNGKT